MEGTGSSAANVYSKEAPAPVQQIVRKVTDFITVKTEPIVGKVTDLANDVWWNCWRRLEDVRSDKWKLLMACILVDFIGMCSYILLLIGEVVDLWWAPACGFFLQYMFGSMLITSFGVIEEFLPLTDIIPTATISWCIVHLESLARVQDLLGIKEHNTKTRFSASLETNAASSKDGRAKED
jgi:hypothetical protein